MNKRQMKNNWNLQFNEINRKTKYFKKPNILSEFYLSNLPAILFFFRKPNIFHPFALEFVEIFADICRYFILKVKC